MRLNLLTFLITIFKLIDVTKIKKRRQICNHPLRDKNRQRQRVKIPRVTLWGLSVVFRIEKWGATETSNIQTDRVVAGILGLRLTLHFSSDEASEAFCVDRDVQRFKGSDVGSRCRYNLGTERVVVAGRRDNVVITLRRCDVQSPDSGGSSSPEWMPL